MVSWQKENNMLKKTFYFESYMQGIDFVLNVAKLAEQLNHHPEILIKYGEIVITTTTHDAGNKITERDEILVKEIDKLLP